MHRNSEVLQPLQIEVLAGGNFYLGLLYKYHTHFFFAAYDRVCSGARLRTSMDNATLTADFTSSNAGCGYLPSASY